MPITLTKKVTSVWSNGRPPATGPGSIHEFVQPVIDTLFAQDKTDGVWSTIDQFSSYRLFADQASATVFFDAINEIAIQIGRTDLTVTIVDI